MVDFIGLSDVRTCTKCGFTGTEDHFYASMTWCRTCVKAYNRSHRASRALNDRVRRVLDGDRVNAMQRDRKARWLSTPEGKTAKSAHNRVYYATHNGKMRRPKTCSVCHRPWTRPLHGHHDDYSQKESVKWTCQRHHSAAEMAKVLVS